LRWRKVVPSPARLPRRYFRRCSPLLSTTLPFSGSRLSQWARVPLTSLEPALIHSKSTRPLLLLLSAILILRVCQLNDLLLALQTSSVLKVPLSESQPFSKRFTSPDQLSSLA